MNHISVPLSVTVLTLAVVSAVAVWHVLRKDRELHRKAVVLRRHLAMELDSYQAKLTQMRQRASRGAANDGQAVDQGRALLTSGCNGDLLGTKVVRGELLRASRDLEHAHGRKLQDSYRQLEAVGTKVAALGQELKRHEALWAAELARPKTTPTPRRAPRTAARRAA